MQREVNEDNGRTYDNAVSAMGKYLIYQSNNDANALNMSKQFIKLLPFKYDLDECKFNESLGLFFCGKNINFFIFVFNRNKHFRVI